MPVYCSFENCSKHARYDYIGSKKYRFCRDHRLDRMVNLRDSMCEIKDCGKVATFSLTKEIATRCAKHKLEGMKNIKSKYCEIKDCEIQASFNFLNKRGSKFCLKHSTAGMISRTKKSKLKHLQTFL